MRNGVSKAFGTRGVWNCCNNVCYTFRKEYPTPQLNTHYSVIVDARDLIHENRRTLVTERRFRASSSADGFVNAGSSCLSSKDNVARVPSVRSSGNERRRRRRRFGIFIIQCESTRLRQRLK